MPLTGTSTRTEALAQYRDNLDWESDATGAKSRAFVAACRWLLSDPQQIQRAGDSLVQFSLASIKEQLDAAKRFADQITANTQSVAAASLPSQCGYNRYGGGY
jgi:alkylation response protein AidB-like acyl-CoA dehydrogenase